jgi:tetratricopeptide (TPR) repeat protein
MTCGCTLGESWLRCRLSSLSRRKAVAVAAIALVMWRPAAADPLKATVEATVSGGYARLIFSMADYDEANVRQAGSVLIISFKQPINVSVDRLAVQAPDYVGGARLDPDGRGVRLALARKVTFNAQSAGEKFFVDLLPDSWKGLPPGLPQDVVADLVRRAHEAEQLVAREHKTVQQQQSAPIRVHVATQPTFTRYVFDLPDQISVSVDRAKDRLILAFDAPLRFDLADAKVSLPSEVKAIDSELDDTSSSVRFSLLAKVDVRTFRDEKGYIVDIVSTDAAPAKTGDRPPETLQAAAPAAITPVASEQGSVAKAVAAKETPRAAISSTATPAVPPLPEGLARPAVKPVDASITQPATPPSSPEAAAAPQPIAPAPLLETRAPADTVKADAPALAPQSGAPATKTAAAPVTPTAPAPATAAAANQGTGKVIAELAHQGANLKLSFAFAVPTPAAVFFRADTLWIVFDSKADIDLGALQGESTRTIRGAEFIHAPDADVVRIKLDRPHLASVAADGPVWTVEIGDSALEPTRALDLTRNLIGPNRSSVSIPFAEPHQMHRIADPEVGDSLLVVTAFAPARGFIHTQDFIEFRALASAQGIVVDPLADDVDVELARDKVVVSRPNGLTLSSTLQALLRGSGLRPAMFDSQLWGFDRQASYVERQSSLIAAAAAAPANKRLAARLDLARFYIARDMYPEAKGVLDAVLADERPTAEDVSATVLRAVTAIMMNRPEDALKDLAQPIVGDQRDAPLWRALAYARQGKWAKARDGFKLAEASIATLPVELQQVALKAEMRAAIEVGDFASAANSLNDFETIGVPHDMEPAMSVLIGRLDEGMGRSEDALAAYRTAADSWDRPAAAQGRLRETVLRFSLGDLKREDVISQLESLTTVWRGDETEIEALQVLARLYTEEGRYRDSFYVMRSALTAHPDWEMTRRIQQEAAKTFDALFLAGRGDALPVIDALALFYDFRELTPIGRRGDEMIRRLADRLVSVDLLDQAADLLQYQVDHRLEGAGRAQVASRLAIIYLMNRKPDRALAVLQATRTADVSTDLRSQRLLLEARALSDLGRHDLALEVIAANEGREAMRLRSDILWAARRWRQSAEQIELMYGDRWQEWQPLSDVERSDILRAEIGFALAEDTLGMGRFREKYAPKMTGTPDARAFEIASAPIGSSGAEFAGVAHAAASTDTLEAFLRDMKSRYPDASAISPPATEAPPGAPSASSQTPDARPASPIGPATTSPAPPSPAPGRTAQR